VQWPEDAPGFKEVPIDDHTREMLRYDDGRQATWKIPLGVRPEDGAPLPSRIGQAYLFFFRWEPGTATVLRARAHRPDICLPAVGWTQLGQPEIRSYPVGENLALPFQHFRFLHNDPGGRPIYAETFFCLREDRVRAGSGGEAATLAFSHWNIAERWEVVRKGMRNPGQQVVEFVLLSRHLLSAEEARTRFAAIVPELVKANAEKLKN
jgi:hypothetical protein